MSPQKDETPKLAARGFQEHLKTAAAFDDNHEAHRAREIAVAQAPTPLVSRSNREHIRTLVRALEPIWSRVRTDISAIKHPDGGSRWTDTPLNVATLEAHVSDGLPRGACPIKAGESTVMLAVLDMDSHKGATPWDEMMRVACELESGLEMLGLYAIPFRSSGGSGIHLMFMWEIPQDAYSVRQALFAGIEMCDYKSGAKGIADKQIEVFPKQNEVGTGPKDRGSQFILPLAGHSAPINLTFGIVLDREAIVDVDWKMSDPVTVIDQPDRALMVLPDAIESIDRVREALFTIRNDGSDGSPDYDRWFPIVCAVHEALGGSEEAKELTIEWSAQNDIFDQPFFEERVWPYIKPADKRDNAITRGTLFAEASKAGWNSATPDGFEDVPGAATETPSPAQQLIAALRKEPRDTTVATWAQRTAPMPKDVAALVLDEVVRLTGVGRRTLAAALGDARRALKRDQRHKDVERRAAERVMMVYRPEDSVSQSREIGLLIIERDMREAMLSFGGCLSQIVDAPMTQAHQHDNEVADAPTTLHVRPHTQASIRALAEKHAMLCVETEQGRKPIAVPTLLLDGLLELNSAEAPQLTGLLTHPIARDDGTILSANGLHKPTGLFLNGVSGTDYRPYTHAEAPAALKRIREVLLEGFEFASELDATVAIAGLFTGVQRRLLDTAPGLAVLAAAQSSGKTTFLRIVHVILTGRDLPVTTLPIGNEAEVEKRLLSLLMQSPAVIGFDNVPDGFTVHSGSLSAAMTSSTFEGRVLGVSRMATVPTNVLIALTGNNLTFGADEISRWMVARLAPRHARPEERNFRHADIVAHALAHRDAVLRDVVGIVAGFRSCGERMTLTGTRFPKWDRMVRQPLIWAGADDVARVFRVNERESEHAQGLRALLLVLHEVFGDRLFSAGDVAKAVSGTGFASPLPDRLRDALETLAVKDVCSSRSVGRALTAKSERTVVLDEEAGTTLRLCRRSDRNDIGAFCISTAG